MLKAQTNTIAVYAETGRFPLLIRQQLQTLKYWLRVSSLPPENVVREAYNAQLALFRDGFPSWCDKVDNILSVLDKQDLLLNALDPRSC